MSSVIGVVQWGLGELVGEIRKKKVETYQLPCECDDAEPLDDADVVL